MTFNRPIISCIIATYNEIQNIEIIKSSISILLRLNEVQVIIVDGASTDGTDMQLKKIKGIELIVERDNGIYDAWNKGLRKVKGYYIGFLGASDLPGEEFLNVVIKTLKGIVTERYPLLIIGNGIRKLGNYERFTKIDKIPDLFSQNNHPKKFGFIHQGALTHSKLFKNGFDTSMTLASDLDLYLRNHKNIAGRILKIENIQVIANYDGISTTIKAFKIYRKEIIHLEKRYGIKLEKPSRIKILLSALISETSFLKIRKLKWKLIEK